MNAPKRPDIPPPSNNNYQYRRPAIKNNFNTFANTQKYGSESKAFYDHGPYT